MARAVVAGVLGVGASLGLAIGGAGSAHADDSAVGVEAAEEADRGPGPGPDRSEVTDPSGELGPQRSVDDAGPVVARGSEPVSERATREPEREPVPARYRAPVSDRLRPAEGTSGSLTAAMSGSTTERGRVAGAEPWDADLDAAEATAPSGPVSSVADPVDAAVLTDVAGDPDVTLSPVGDRPLRGAATDAALPVRVSSPAGPVDAAVPTDDARYPDVTSSPVGDRPLRPPAATDAAPPVPVPATGPAVPASGAGDPTAAVPSVRTRWLPPAALVGHVRDQPLPSPALRRHVRSLVEARGAHSALRDRILADGGGRPVFGNGYANPDAPPAWWAADPAAPSTRLDLFRQRAWQSGTPGTGAAHPATDLLSPVVARLVAEGVGGGRSAPGPSDLPGPGRLWERPTSDDTSLQTTAWPDDLLLAELPSGVAPAGVGAAALQTTTAPLVQVDFTPDGGNNRGTGVVLDPSSLSPALRAPAASDGDPSYILTVKHGLPTDVYGEVLGPVERIALLLPRAPGEQRARPVAAEVSAVRVSGSSDLALLVVRGDRAGIGPGVRVVSAEPPVGTAVSYAGLNPDGATITRSGLIVGPPRNMPLGSNRGTRWGNPIITSIPPLRGGNSGGPLFTPAGELIGVLSGSDAGTVAAAGNGRTYFTSNGDVRLFLQDAGNSADVALPSREVRLVVPRSFPEQPIQWRADAGAEGDTVTATGPA